MLDQLFNDSSLLQAYDRILPYAVHYRDILKTHVAELSECNNIIDLGCGTGSCTLELLSLGKTVTAVDISKKSLQKLDALACSREFTSRLRILHQDVTNLKGVQNEFDGASSMIMAHLVSDYEAHIAETLRVLSPGGRMVLTARAADKDPELLVRSTEESLKEQGLYEELKDDFNVVADQLLRTAARRSKSLISVAEAIEKLAKCGYVEIRELQNKSLGVMYTLVASKPEA